MDVAEIAGKLTAAQRAHLLAFPNNRRGCGGTAKPLHARGLLTHYYPSRAVNKPKLTDLGLAVRAHLQGTLPNPVPSSCAEVGR
jgi:hypothetical protein